MVSSKEQRTGSRVASEGREDAGDSCRVVYLLGAGATQGCISHWGSRHDLTMDSVCEEVSRQLRFMVIDKYEHHAGIRGLYNRLLEPEQRLDIEQLITFLEDSPSAAYQQFANDLREVFSSVLRSRLEEVENEPGSSRSWLYAVLVDMHEVAANRERLQGFLTLNYDVFLERAIVKELRRQVDYGIAPREEYGTGRPVTVLKMHGSFGWSKDWPIDTELRHSTGLWIPPGIKKPKNDYPFNVIWGRARELLDCDVLRIIGCNLGPNDWDLVSLLFTTRHAYPSGPTYSVEVISGFETVDRIRKMFPYLDVRWIPELPNIREQVVGGLLGGSESRAFDELPEDLQSLAIQRAREEISNPFSDWLTFMGNTLAVAGDVSTATGVFEKFTDAIA